MAAGAAVDSALVRVIPPGRLLVWEAGTQSVRMVNTDGTAPRLLASGISSDFGAFPHYSPSGATVAFHAGAAGAYGGLPSRVVVMDSSGGSQREISMPPGVTQIMHPRPLADGTVMVIALETSMSTASGFVTPTAVYSIRADGTATRLAGLPSAAAIYGRADISPDGTRVAFVVSGDPYFSQPGPLNVLNLTNGQVTQVAANATSPSWAPTSDRLAYLVPTNTYLSDGTVATVNADGTGTVALSAAGGFSPGLAWSPKGDYVLGRANSTAGLRAVRVRDGANVLLKLPITSGNYPGGLADYYQPDWR